MLGSQQRLGSLRIVSVVLNIESPFETADEASTVAGLNRFHGDCNESSTKKDAKGHLQMRRVRLMA